MAREIFRPDWRTPSDDMEETAGKAPFKLGQVIQHSDGTWWEFVRATGTIDQYDAVNIAPSTFRAKATGAGTTYGSRFGVANAAFKAGEGGWVQVFGRATVNAKANTVANGGLYTNATAGHVFSTAGGHKNIRGMILVAARGAGDGTATAELTWPVQWD